MVENDLLQAALERDRQSLGKAYADEAAGVRISATNYRHAYWTFAHRTTRSVALSQTGTEFLPLAQLILDDLEPALRSISELKSLNAGHVRVAAPQLMACTLLPQAVAAFAGRHPKVEVLIVDCEIEDVASRVLSGEVDLGIGPERAASDERDLMRRCFAEHVRC